MPAKKVIITVLVLIFGVGGIVTGAMLLRHRQDLQSRAAVQGGRAEMTFQPNSGSYQVGDTILLGVYVNTDGIAVSTIKSLVTYPYTGATPEVTASNISINPVFSSGDWSCESTDVTQDFGQVKINISCATVSASGYSTTTDTLFASMDLKIERTPVASPFIIDFDQAGSAIYQLSNGEDILNVPTASGVYTVGGGTNISPTVSVEPSVTTTVTPSVSVSATPTTFVFSTVTPTKVATTTPAQLMDSGFSAPTFIAIAAGLLLILTALAIAL